MSGYLVSQHFNRQPSKNKEVSVTYLFQAVLQMPPTGNVCSNYKLKKYKYKVPNILKKNPCTFPVCLIKTADVLSSRHLTICLNESSLLK